MHLLSVQSEALGFSWRRQRRTFVLKFSGNVAALTAAKVDAPKIYLIVDNRVGQSRSL